MLQRLIIMHETTNKTCSVNREKLYVSRIKKIGILKAHLM